MSSFTVASTLAININSYLSEINHTFFDAITSLNDLLNGLHWNESEKLCVLKRISFLAYIQDHLYHSDKYSEMSFIELNSAVDNEVGLELKNATIQVFDNTFGYDSTSIEEEEHFQKLILRVCLYHRQWVQSSNEENIVFRSDFTDDYYEWFLYTNKLEDKPLEDRCVGMHDAWALALMYGVHCCEDGKYIFTPKKELGANPDVPDEQLLIVNDTNLEEEVEKMLPTILPKSAVRVQFNDLFHGEIRTMRLEKRRLSQLVDYADLTKEEKIKDLIPVIVCHYVNKV